MDCVQAPGLTLSIEVVTQRPRLIEMLLAPVRRLTVDHADPSSLAAESEPTLSESRTSPPREKQEAAPSRTAGRFDSDRSFRHLEALVRIGPRPAGSEGVAAARAYVTAELEKAGLTVERESFAAKTPDGILDLENVYDRLPDLLLSVARTASGLPPPASGGFVSD